MSDPLPARPPRNPAANTRAERGASGNPSSFRRRRLPGLVAILAANLLGCGNPNHSDSAPVDSSAAPPEVTVATPVPKRLSDWDEYTGRLASPETVELRSRVSGYLEKVHFREGSDVKAGDLLFSLDPRPFRAVFDRASAELARAKQRAELAGGEANRARGLFAARAISEDNHDERVKAATEAVESVRAAEATLAAARLDLDFTEVRAPISGRTSNARITAGNLVTGGTGSATLLTTLVSLDPVWCYLDVDERSALRYRELERTGQRTSANAGSVEARMGLVGEDDLRRVGRLDFIDNQVNPATGTIRVRGVFPNSDGLATPGSFVRIRIPGRLDYDAVLVRDVALGSDQGRPFVWVVGPDDQVTFRPVTTGPLVDGLRAIRTGLSPADRVIINGLQVVRPGTKVKPRTADMAVTRATAPATSPPTAAAIPPIRAPANGHP